MRMVAHALSGRRVGVAILDLLFIKCIRAFIILTIGKHTKQAFI
jgi:hypothetical protein